MTQGAPLGRLVPTATLLYYLGDTLLAFAPIDD